VLRVDGANLSTIEMATAVAFQGHTIELPVAQVGRGCQARHSASPGIVTRVGLREGLVHVLGPKSDKAVVFSTKRACPSCGKSFAELDPRLFSFNSKHGWCDSCFGTGVEMTGFDEEQSGEEIWWNEWYEPRAYALQVV